MIFCFNSRARSFVAFCYELSIIAAFARLFVGGLFYSRILVFQVFPNFFDNLN